MRELTIDELESISGGKNATNVKPCCSCCNTNNPCMGAYVSYDGGKTWQWENF